MVVMESRRVDSARKERDMGLQRPRSCAHADSAMSTPTGCNFSETHPSHENIEIPSGASTLCKTTVI